MTARMSIVIPAHDEGALVRTSLERMLADAAPGEFDVVVVANGCSDDTAAQASRVSGVRVIEIPEGSKIAALNAGDRATAVFPRAYVDADVEVTTAALRRLADVLDETAAPRAAAPTLEVDASASSAAVQHHTRIWALSDYRRSGHIGSGIYAVNTAGRRRWGRFPNVVADDRFVQMRFHRSERVTVPDATFRVMAPRDLPTLVRRGTRIELGNRQLPASADGSSRGALLQRVLRTPRLWRSFPFYAYGYLMPKVRARLHRGGAVSWDRDTALREAALRDPAPRDPAPRDFAPSDPAPRDPEPQEAGLREAAAR